jgi:hypothetical protein
MTSTSLCIDIKNTQLEFIADLKENVFSGPIEQGELFTVSFFFERLHPERAMDHVVSHVLPWKKQIRKRDVHFFQNNKHIFEGLPADRVEYYSEKLSKDIDEESRNVMWEFFDTMIELAEQYKKHK